MKYLKSKFSKAGVIFLSLFFIIHHGYCQDKIEREEGVKESEVPTEAVKWLYDAFEKIKRPKWYKEFSDAGISYEAKFKLADCFHSVEFDSLGMVQDVEVELKWTEIKEKPKSAIQNYFEKEFKDYNILKIQIQFSGEPDDLEDFFDEDEREGILIQYEIEFLATDFSGETQIWEGTFDQDGQYLEKRKIIIREMDNIIF